MWVERILGGLLVLGLAIVTYQHLNRYEEYTALEILAAQDVPDEALPVYAQFVVTQSLRLEVPIELIKIRLPYFSPEDEKEFDVSLLRNQEIVEKWQLETEPGVVEKALQLSDPKLVGGSLEVRIDGQRISHDEKDRAPRLFIEKADENYPNGNYRIAENEKAGDVALSLTARRRVWQRVLASWHDDWLAGVQAGGWWLLGALIVYASPAVVGRLGRQSWNRLRGDG